MKIGFVGLGNMGGPMALNLIKAGHVLTVFDLSAASLARLVEAGAKAAGSPTAIAQSDAELIITLLPTAAHVKSAYLGAEGMLAHVKPGVFLIDCSTIDPHTAREVAKEAFERGNPMLDAPVSSGTAGANAGTLTFMVGGTIADFERARPTLEAMGKNIVHCGDIGNGQVAKIANNMLLGVSMIAVSEAMAFGASLGMEAGVLAGIINTSSGRCWSSDTYNPYPGVLENTPAARGYTGGFGTDLMLNDLVLASEAAEQIGQPVHLGTFAQLLYQSFSAQGNGSLDFSAIINMYRKDA